MFDILYNIWLWWGIISLSIIAGAFIVAITVDDDFAALIIVGLVAGLLWLIASIIAAAFWICAWAISTVCGWTFAYSLAVVIIVYFGVKIMANLLSD